MKTELSEGMCIFISPKCEDTKRVCGWNEFMDQYKGTIQEIQRISKYENHYTISFLDVNNSENGFNWSIEDINSLKDCSLENNKNLKSFYFNPKELIL